MKSQRSKRLDFFLSLAARRRHRALVTTLCAAVAAPVNVVAQSTSSSGHNFADLSLEELMNETVTSVSKREQKLTEAAAAVFVLTSDDIRRSGATSIAEALRLVPGVNVAAVNSSQWSISARGYNNIFANKLLVLVDGRPVYSPVFAGVYWDAMQPILDDVDRVEVIRGPGATVWGANAVNGVINVVTLSAKDTQGGLLYGSGGDVLETNNGVRYGGQLGERTYYRVYGGAFSKDDYRLPDGRKADDSWRGEHGGVRLDHYTKGDAQLTWIADASGVETDDHNTNANHYSTLGRLTKRWSDRSGVEVQVSYDQTERDEADRSFSRSDTVDFTAQHTFAAGERNDIIWGVGYRFADMKLEEISFETLVRDDEVDTELFSFFVQDEFRLVPDKVILTAGVKVEHNDYTGYELQPSARAVIKPTEKQTIWAAVSRAVRTPSALEGRDVFAIMAGAPFSTPGGVYIPRIVGNPDLESEVLWAYELGYRVQPTARTSVDVAAFYNVYDNLVGLGEISRLVNGTPGTAEMPFSNTSGGRIYGGEVALTVAPTDSWRLSASYSLLMVDLPGSAPSNPYERASPRNQVVLRSTYDFSARLSVDAQLRYVDTIQGVPSYITADLRLAYRITDQLEFSLVGQNLLDDQHPEQGPFYLTTPTEVPRSFYGKLTWRF
jgi:iron complex outermembrane receptor protein